MIKIKKILILMQSKIIAIDKLKIMPEEILVEQVLDIKHKFKEEVKKIIE